MLIQFKFKNFISYKEEAVLNLTRVKAFRELERSHIIKTKKGFDLLKSTAIYGSNGGGKSNLMRAMSYMTKVIHNSFADSLKKHEDKEPIDLHFKLSTQTENEPTLFEVLFIKNDSIYRYGYEIKNSEIISEWLFKKVEVETLLFERKLQDFKINSKGFPEGNKYKQNVNSNVLFLSLLAQNNAKESSIIFEWFAYVNAISGLDDKYHENVTTTLLNNMPGFKNWLNVAVKFLEISNIDSSKDKKIVTYHNKFDNNNIIVDSIPFDFEIESDGTQKLINLLGAIYDTLRFGKILFIDELDAKLHPNLSRKLLQLFHKFNTTNSQFIFTAHDATLLDKEILRRDQIWFVDRDKFGSSHLYSMAEFDANVVRNTSDFRKKYLSSVFGAAESMKISNELIELLHVK